MSPVTPVSPPAPSKKLRFIHAGLPEVTTTTTTTIIIQKTAILGTAHILRKILM
jgi:hypothetical protein